VSKDERNEISILLEKGYSRRAIAGALHRSVSTISDELNKNSVKKIYDPNKAQHKAYVRRHNASFRGKKIVAHRTLRKFIEGALCDGQSPEAIAGRIQYHEKHLPRIGKDTIYRFLDSPYGRLIAHKRKKKKPKYRRPKVTQLRDRTFIDRRPKIIEKRGRVGDGEGDFILSGRNGKGILLVLVDRKIRAAFLEFILDISIDNVHAAFLRIKKRFPEMRTVTFDNDVLLNMHKALEELLEITIYFCHPYSSWEKGSVEHANGIIRQTIPKSSDLSAYDPEIFPFLEEKLNNRFMKCLRYATPEEKLAAYRKCTKQRKQKTTRKRRVKSRR
jgi:transposase, IS30 family